MYKLPLLFFAALFCCMHTQAQTDNYPDTAVITSSPVEERLSDYNADRTNPLTDTAMILRTVPLNNDSVRAWKEKKDYAWIKNLDSSLRALRKKAEPPKFELKSYSFWDRLFASNILNIIFWVIAGSMVLFIIYRLFLSNGLFALSAKKRVNENKEDEENYENISDKDFSELFNKAYAAADYRTATRWLFLMTLQKLDEKEMIRFGADKTNAMYIKELPPAKRDGFASLSLYYEYIWYGKAPLQKETFDAVRAKFTEFLNRL